MSERALAVYALAHSTEPEDVEDGDSGLAEVSAWLDVHDAAKRKARDRAERKAAAANRENEALRLELRALRHANFILQRNYESSTGGGYRVRYEKVTEMVLMARELLAPGVTGIPDATPKTLEPWLGPKWSRAAKAKEPESD